MNEICPITYIKSRTFERGYPDARLVYRDFQLQPTESITLRGYNELWLLLYADEGIRIESDYGVYDYESELDEQIHEHADLILLTNKVNSKRRIRFLQAILKVGSEGIQTKESRTSKMNN